MTNNLSDFDDKRVTLHKRIINYFSKYLSENFDLFPHALRAVDKINDKEEWVRELDDLICVIFNKVISGRGIHGFLR